MVGLVFRDLICVRVIFKTYKKGMAGKGTPLNKALAQW